MVPRMDGVGPASAAPGGTSERALFASIALSPIATVITNPRLPDNPVVAANAAFCALTGYDESEILGRNCRFLAGASTEPWLTERIRQAIRSPAATLTELVNYRKDGTPFRNAVLIAPILDPDGSVAWFLGSQVEVGSTDDDAPLAIRQQRAQGMVARLSPRQRQVLSEMARGFRNKQIAWRLSISEKTVKMHRGLMLEKLGLSTSGDAIRLAVEAGL
jgi:PAS domain S-box-containing protein